MLAFGNTHSPPGKSQSWVYKCYKRKIWLNWLLDLGTPMSDGGFMVMLSEIWL